MKVSGPLKWTKKDGAQNAINACLREIRFQDKCVEAAHFFKYQMSISSVENFYVSILQVPTHISPIELKGDRSKLVLFSDCRLAKAIYF